MIANWYLMLVRAIVGVSATYMGANLLLAFARNHYTHKPKRWLVGWQGVLFLAVGMDALWRTSTRANFIFLQTPQNVTSWPYLLTGGFIAIGATGTLITWLKWPASRTTGGHDRRYDDKET